MLFRYGVCNALVTILNAEQRSQMMRALILIAAIVLVLALVGWVTFSRDDGRTSINLETQEIRQDTKQMLETGSEALHRAGDAAAPEEPHDGTSQDARP
jgi:hypothetical protein